MIALTMVPLVGGERRILRAALMDYLPPKHIYLQGDGSVVVYYDGDVMPAVPEPSNVPSVVTRGQFRLALAQLGLLSAVEAALAAAPVGVQIEYADRQEFHRHYPIILSMAAALNKTPEEIDAVFELAATL